MPSSARKTAATADISLAPLKTCLANLPASLVSILSNANTAAQNVVIEIQFRTQLRSSGGSESGQSPAKGPSLQSAYLGWSGLPSRKRPATRPARNGRATGRSEQDSPVIDIDSDFAHVLGLQNGQNVSIYLHLDPPVIKSVHIEPLTAEDWEIIELHAGFLESNLLSQVRALPNPRYSPAQTPRLGAPHPLVLHISPTSAAKVVVTETTPEVSDEFAFAKISPNAEVIVAPKLRPEGQSSNSSDHHGRTESGGTATRHLEEVKRSKGGGQSFVLIRGFDRNVCHGWFPNSDEEGEKEKEREDGLCLWLPEEIRSSPAFLGQRLAFISVLRPAGLKAQLDQDQMNRLKEQELGEPGLMASKVVCRLETWTDAPSRQNAVLSSILCAVLGFEMMAGCIIKVEKAPQVTSHSQIRSFKLYPFLPASSKPEGLRFGGDTESSRQATVAGILERHGQHGGLLTGPLSDRVLLPPAPSGNRMPAFDGGVLRFSTGDDKRDKTHIWIIGLPKGSLDIQSEIPQPLSQKVLYPTLNRGFSGVEPELIGIKTAIEKCMTNLRYGSSVLLTGSIGSGKTSLSQLVCQQLGEAFLFNTTFFPCRKLIIDETRISVIKDTLARLFMSAAWCSRLGGRSVVVLDDLDTVCPIETELQVGNDSSRSRLIAEVLCSIARQYCFPGSGVALLATAQSKDAVNHLIVSGHILLDIVKLDAPNKDARHNILKRLVQQNRPDNRQWHKREASTGQDPAKSPSRPQASSMSQDNFSLSSSLDLLDLARRTDGFQPGDLRLLVSRTRTECLTRSLLSRTDGVTPLVLTEEDFGAALQNFTPSSLRSVPLTRSTTTFSSIGGLQFTRSVLLETLLYPTKYAPVFSQCPLRLRSGILLYGYPGCGKTLLASAVAGECGLNFISVKGPEILNKYIGASEKSVRDLFERAQAARPCILFFDEFDSVAPRRGHDSTGVTDRVVNQLLTQMDGAEGLEGVYVLAATSRPDLIDPALLRPGRLDKSLLCPMPSRDDREDILRAVGQNLHLDPRITTSDRLIEISERTQGFSGADLQALLYNAHLEAVHELLGDHDPSQVAMSDVKNLAKPTRSDRSKTKPTTSKPHHPTDSIPMHFPASPSHPHPIPLETSNLLSTLSTHQTAQKAILRAQRRDPYGLNPRPLSPKPDSETTAPDSSAPTGSRVTITWPHIERALASTKRSISAVERKRLRGIYRNFAGDGRGGEADVENGDEGGDGGLGSGLEVGGRVTLM